MMRWIDSECISYEEGSKKDIYIFYKQRTRRRIKYVCAIKLEFLSLLPLSKSILTTINTSPYCILYVSC